MLNSYANGGAPAPQLHPAVAAAAALAAAGFAVCRVSPESKRAYKPSWTTRTEPPADFLADDLLGIMAGPLSNAGQPGHALVTVDLDAAEAVELADKFLPPTDMIEGRPGKPRSHPYYLIPLASIPDGFRSTARAAAPACVAAAGHPGPRTVSYRRPADADGERAEVVRMIGTGGMTVCPPSPHPSGETRAWEGGKRGDPAVVDFQVLFEAVRALALAAGAEDRDAHPDAADDDGPAAWPELDEALRARVAAYLACCEPSVSGAGGHDALLWAARVVVRGFLVDPDAAADVLAASFNPRCSPPWSRDELAHKTREAAAVEFGKPWGWLLDGAEAAPPGAAGDAAGPGTGAPAAPPDDGYEQELPPPRGPSGRRPPVACSDAANGWRFATDHALTARHVDAMNAWFIWDGTRWRRDETRRVMELAKDSAARLHAAAADYFNRAMRGGDETQGARAKGLQAWAAKSFDHTRLTKMIALAASDPRIARTADEFDRAPFLLNCPNGTVDLATGVLRPHDRGDHLTQLCPTPYDPGASCPEWEKFLSGVFAGDQNLVDYVRRLLGYSITGSDREDVFAVLWGRGSNGKSTFTETLEAVLGSDYATQVAEGALMAKAGDGACHSTDIADLRGKRVALASETEDGKALAKSLMKRLSGGGSIKARNPYERNQEFAQTWTIFLQTNYKPVISGATEAEWRRIVLVPFTVHYWDPDKPAREGEVRDPARRADKLLGGKLAAEAPGILAWLVRGCLEWQRDGMGHAGAVTEATRQYRQEEDLVERFVAERVDRVDGQHFHCSTLYREFRTWCDGQVPAHVVPSPRKFGDEMTDRGFTRNSNGTKYLGLVFRANFGAFNR